VLAALVGTAPISAFGERSGAFAERSAGSFADRLPATSRLDRERLTNLPGNLHFAEWFTTASRKGSRNCLSAQEAFINSQQSHITPAKAQER
jgi:hypothetical protein